jgi:hypothetical protein
MTNSKWRMTQGCQIESFSIWFDFRFRRRRNLSIWFDSNLISICFNLRFDSIENLFSNPKKIAMVKLGNFQGDPPKCQKQLAKSYVIPLFANFSIFTVKVFDFLFSKPSPNHQIVWKITKKRKKIHSIWSAILHTILFDLSQNIWFNNQIQFDFDSIWQPWDDSFNSTDFWWKIKDD